MGVDYGVYLGPYAVASFHMVTVAVEARTCINPECKNRGDSFAVSKFCPECGSAITTIGRETPRPSVDPWEVAEKIGGALHLPLGDNFADEMDKMMAHLWLPNRTNDGVGWTGFDPRRVVQNVRVAHNRIDHETARFLSYYSEALSALRAAYGPDKVVIDWGLISYIW